MLDFDGATSGGYVLLINFDLLLCVNYNLTKLKFRVSLQDSSGVNFLVCLLMMLLDTFLYCVIGLFLDKVCLLNFLCLGSSCPESTMFA